MSRKFSFALLLVCVLGFVLGVVELFKLRFETGDVYPAYSSLRTDPLGTSAFYESLGRMPGVNVRRDFRMSDQLPSGNEIAYLHIAGNSLEWEEISEDSFKSIEEFLHRGGRLVIALEPQTSRYFDFSTNSLAVPPAGKSNNKKSNPKKSSKRKKLLGEDPFYKTVSLDERWGVGFDFKPLKADGDAYKPLEVLNRDEPSLPETISWHSGTVMTNLDDSWRVIYKRGNDAVLAERKFGPGSVVFSTDSFFLSNEALQKDRHSDLLSWVIGPCRDIMFDEAHLGIVNNPGVTTLMRNYHLHGLMAGLLVLAGLFIWKNSVSFVPVREDQRNEDAVAGKDSATGFVNLLRRHIKSDALLDICVAEWKKSYSQGKYSSARMDRMESLVKTQNALAPNERTPVATYRAICLALKQTNAAAGVSEPATRTTQDVSLPP